MLPLCLLSSGNITNLTYAEFVILCGWRQLLYPATGVITPSVQWSTVKNIFVCFAFIASRNFIKEKFLLAGWPDGFVCLFIAMFACWRLLYRSQFDNDIHQTLHAEKTVELEKNT